MRDKRKMRMWGHEVTVWTLAEIQVLQSTVWQLSGHV